MLTRLSQRWMQAMLNRPRALLALALVLTVIGGWQAAKLRLDTDLRGLLPADHPVLASLDRVEKSFGSLGSINVIVADADASTRHAFADALADRAAGHPLLASVEHKVPFAYFADHALYYLNKADFAKLEDLVAGWQHAELCQASPSLCVEKPDLAAGEKLREFIAAKQSEAADRIGFKDYFEREELSALALFLHPIKPSSDVEFSVEVAQAMRALAQEVYASPGPWHQNNMRYNLVGPYTAKADEKPIVRHDMVVSGIVAALGVTGLLVLLFRSVRATLILLIPLLVGVAWTLGATNLLLGHLNTMTSLITSVLMGMGIDAGIHFFQLIQREAKSNTNEQIDGEALKGPALGRAIVRAFAQLSAPLLTASLTTIGAFAAMVASRFPAFHEFGVVSILGVFFCVLSMITVFPALVIVLGLSGREAKPLLPIGEHFVVPLIRHPHRICLVVALLCAASVPGVMWMREHGFETNGRELQSDSARKVTESDVFLLSRILKKDVHAAILTGRDPQEIARLRQRLLEHHATRVADHSSVVASIVGLADLLPPPEIDQAQRKEAIAELSRALTPRTWARLEGRDPDLASPQTGVNQDEDDEFVDLHDAIEKPTPGTTNEAAAAKSASTDNSVPAADPAEVTGDSAAAANEAAPAPQKAVLDADQVALLRRMLGAKHVEAANLPPAIREKFIAADGREAILAYPAFDAADMESALRFMDEMDEALHGQTDEIFVGESTVYATMLAMMRDESPSILLAAVLIIAACVALQMRRIGSTLLTLVPLLIATIWIFGFMGTFGLKLTLFNVPLFPAILGIGVDNTVYLMSALQLAGRSQAIEAALLSKIRHTGQAIFYSTLTTVVGFGAFLVADSGGLRSIGMLAMIGIAIAAFAAFFTLPPLMVLVFRRKSPELQP
jgi:predicted RND superfamily exporter protein